MPEKQGACPAALCGALTALSENYGTICSICCALILLDLLTGLAKAKIQGRLSSDTGYKGFWRKAALLAALVAWICCRSTPLQPSGTPGTSSTSADFCPHYTNAGIRCKSCPCGEQFSGGPCSPL